jgi:hypothetical protein
MKMKFDPRRLARKLTYANVVATLALMLVLSGGTALAATHLISGKQIAKGTISATNIKKHTLTSVLFKKGVQLRGRTGRTGATGAPGAAGPAGPAGATGSAAAYGLITKNANGNLVFNSALSSGFTAVYAPSNGYICITPPAGAPAASLIVTDASNETAQWDQVSPAQCGGTGYELANENSASALVGELAIALP